jgi:hypothetical protein
MDDDLINFERLVETVFSDQPRPPRSIVLQMTDDSIAQFAPDEEPVQEFFIDLAFSGVKHLWGDVNLAQLTKDQFTLLNRYMNSVGVSLDLTVLFTDGTTGPAFQEGETREPASFLVYVRWL